MAFAIVLIAVSAAWRPEGAGASEEPVIAVLNVERVIRGSNAGQALQDRIDQIRSDNQAKDRESESALRAESETLSKQRAVLSDEAFDQKQKELQSRLDTLRREFEARRERLQSAVNEAWSQIHAAMLEVTKVLASERKIDIVVSHEGTVLISKNMNITKDVLERLNAELTQVPLAIEAQ